MTIDLNADVGESFGHYVVGHDRELMPYITSANIACGFHGGDPHVMRQTMQLALSHGVSLGAHPGYPDLAGFGRRVIPLAPQEVEDVVVYQVGAASAMAHACGGTLRHVKPHGALYNVAAERRDIAEAVARGVAAVDAGLVLVGLAGSELLAAGRAAGLRVASEVFADRGYNSNGRLLPRHDAGAIIDDVQLVSERAVWMVLNRHLRAQDGSELPVDVDTICIHGDTPGAPTLARAVRNALVDAGIAVHSTTRTSPFRKIE